MKAKHLNSVNELIRLRNFLGRYNAKRGNIEIRDSRTHEVHTLGVQKWGGGSGEDIDSYGWLVSRFIQEELDKQVMCKIISVMKEAADMIDEHLKSLGVEV